MIGDEDLSMLAELNRLECALLDAAAAEHRARYESAARQFERHDARAVREARAAHQVADEVLAGAQSAYVAFIDARAAA